MATATLPEFNSEWFAWKNGGTTHPSIIHKIYPHFWHFMDIIIHPSHHP
jgi:hypothetical protein